MLVQRRNWRTSRIIHTLQEFFNIFKDFHVISTMNLQIFNTHLVLIISNTFQQFLCLCLIKVYHQSYFDMPSISFMFLVKIGTCSLLFLNNVCVGTENITSTFIMLTIYFSSHISSNNQNLYTLLSLLYNYHHKSYNFHKTVDIKMWFVSTNPLSNVDVIRDNIPLYLTYSFINTFQIFSADILNYEGNIPNKILKPTIITMTTPSLQK